MEPFLSNRPCPKCGSLALSTQLHRKGLVRCRLREWRREHMHRVCVDCRHEWAETPAGSTSPAETRMPTRLSA